MVLGYQLSICFQRMKHLVGTGADGRIQTLKETYSIFKEELC
jgi:hypothetical protein